jgi:hypothetical protein
MEQRKSAALTSPFVRDTTHDFAIDVNEINLLLARAGWLLLPLLPHNRSCRKFTPFLQMCTPDGSL